ncbi:methyl-accepting chemotaxis protein, partial [Poseidonibacter sp.]|uniref:methyl-accepting chemotaxis protein n=1 Tax=Poseidonibacter sp. TaxID=2321188 RepID=UPI003C74A47C
MFNKKHKIEETVVEENVSQVLEVEAENSIDFLEYLTKVNSLLKFITEMDYIKDMLIGVNKQGEMIENVASSSQEMTATIEDISNFVQESSSKTGKTIEVANQSLIEISDAFEEVSRSFESSKQVQLTMDKVRDEAKKINEMVTVIKGVAEQTNLLALNASIEAARAGEQGRGFAVVANEIKKLAENTNQQVEHINTTVNNLTAEINNTNKALEDSNASFDKGKIKMNEAVGSLDTMHVDLKYINDAFVEISASIEEQTAASQEMSSSIMIINEETKDLNQKIERTGRARNSISNIINDIRVEMLEESIEMDMATQIEISMCDHLMWKWRAYNMLLGYQELTESAVGTHHTCKLGRWCDETHFENKDMTKAVNDIEKPHKELHELVKHAIKAYNNG